MLLKQYYLYRKIPKHVREIKVLSKLYYQSIPKPYKSYGTCWIVQKLKAMEVVLNNYGRFMRHLESLAHANSQALKHSEITRGARKWQNSKYPIHPVIKS